MPAFPALESWAKAAGLSWASREELVADPRVVGHVQSELLAMLEDLASFEKPKRVALLAEEFSVENGLLTPTLKVKRRVVQERLATVIDRLYSEEAVDASER